MLHPGQRFPLNGHTYHVVSVSPCRAHCVTHLAHTFTVTDKSGAPKVITRAESHGLDISPDSQIALLLEWQRTHMVAD